ncbi:MAG: hypothetical protein GEV11_15565 [Streptosporangiales bacterium]|nr:hypothetical protein [Streptosporangiales bacterium]
MNGIPRSAGPTRRTVLRAAAAGAAGLALPPAVQSPALAGSEDPIVAWIDRTARPLRGIDPGLPIGDLAPLRGIVRGAPLGDPAEIVGQTTFNLQNRALFDLMEWARAYNAARPPRERVRFLGADVLQLREVQFTELKRYVADVAPERSAALSTHLDPLRIQGSPGRHVGWYRQLDPADQQELIGHARAVRRLIDEVPDGSSAVGRFDVVMHAFTLAGFYESNTRDGDANDTR